MGLTLAEEKNAEELTCPCKSLHGGDAGCRGSRSVMKERVSKGEEGDEGEDVRPPHGDGQSKREPRGWADL